jgi:hypothetical protein
MEMEEKRGQVRKAVDGLIEVLDVSSGETVGHLANISQNGFMLVAREHDIKPNMVFQFRFFFPVPIKDRDSVDCGAESLWSDPTMAESGCWAGFQIIDISESDSSVLTHLIDNL